MEERRVERVQREARDVVRERLRVPERQHRAEPRPAREPAPQRQRPRADAMRLLEQDQVVECEVGLERVAVDHERHRRQPREQHPRREREGARARARARLRAAGGRPAAGGAWSHARGLPSSRALEEASRAYRRAGATAPRPATPALSLQVILEVPPAPAIPRSVSRYTAKLASQWVPIQLPPRAPSSPTSAWRAAARSDRKST